MPKRKKPPPAKRIVTTETVKANKNSPPIVVIPPGDAKMLEGLREGKEPEKAAKDAGMPMSVESAETHASYLLQRYNSVMIEALQENGITVNKLAEKLGEHLDAERPVIVKGVVRKYPDYTTQQRAVNTVLDILPGARAPKQMEVETRSLEAILIKIQHEHKEDDDGW